VRIVLDTNTLVSGVISPGGAPRQLLNAARSQMFDLCSSAVLMAELQDVLSREKFATRLAQAGLIPMDIVRELRRMSYMNAPTSVPRVVLDDPDDDHVLACAVAAQADLIDSGDKHLHGLGGQYQGIRIVNASVAMQIISVRQD
jgi:putative PIN family toxin of toxin-antitoxin system